MRFRRAQDSDLEALVDLQNANSIAADTTLDRAEGFLSSAFSAQDFAALNQDLAIVVGVDDTTQKLLGFVCCSTLPFNKDASLPGAMIARFDRAQLDGQALANYKSAIAGPVCVDKGSRGLGIFERLYGELLQLIPARYGALVALVSTSNARSLAAHKKIGMVEVDQFAYNGKTYNTIAMKIGQR